MPEMERFIKIDWLSFTTRRELTDVLQMFSYLPNPLKIQEKGRNGYNFHFSSADGVTVAFTPERDDIHVNLSGFACDGALIDMLNLFNEKDNITRIDIALDCVNSGFTCADIWGLLQSGSYMSVSSDIRQYKGLLREGGYTIYIGAKASERMVRIYDKGIESKKGGDWVRYELQLRGLSANTFGHRLKTNPEALSDSFSGLLNKQIRLTAWPIDKNDHKRGETPTYELWDKVTGGIPPQSLRVGPRTESTVSSVMKHVKNCASSLRSLQLGMNDYKEFIVDIMENAKLKEKHVKVIDDLLYWDLKNQDDRGATEQEYFGMVYSEQ